MRKALLILMTLTSSCFAAFPTHSNISTVDMSKVTGKFDSFNWKWVGYNSQTNRITLIDGYTTNPIVSTNVTTNVVGVVTNISTNTTITGYVPNYVNMNGYTISVRISRLNDTGGVTTYNAVTPTVSGSNVSWEISYTNIPPNNTYYTEALAWEGDTNLTRSIFQGMITVNNSIYGNDETEYPWPSLSATQTTQVYCAQAGTAQVAVVTLSATTAETVTGAQSNLIASALQGGSNVSALVNDAGYLQSVTNHNQAWSTITDTPVSLAGYGITNDVLYPASTNLENFTSITNAHAQLTGTAAHGLGTASTHAEGDFATAAQGTNADNWASNSNQVFWLDGRYAGNRSVWGTNMSVANINATAYGASQHGKNVGTMSIGETAYGASQRGYNSIAATMSIGTGSWGASQFGRNDGTDMSIDAYSYGAVQFGYNEGTMRIGGQSYGAAQFLHNEAGTAVINNSIKGAAQFGYLGSGATATNGGNGSIQVLNLSAGQTAIMSGNASLGLGACTVSDSQSIVAGDGSVSHGDGSITASGGFWHGANPVLTNPAVFATAAQGTNADNWASNSNQVFWLDGRYDGNRSVWGHGLDLSWIDSSASGAVMRGAVNDGTMSIGTNSYGAMQNGYAYSEGGKMQMGNRCWGTIQSGTAENGTMSIGNDVYGGLQLGNASISSTMSIGVDGHGVIQSGYALYGTMSIDGSAHGAMQSGFCESIMNIGDSAYGAMQRGHSMNGGSMRIGNESFGAMQGGNVDNAAATNNGTGALQLFSLTGGQQALTTSGGDASILLGAGTSSNKNAIVAGDSQVSHGDGSVTAASMYSPIFTGNRSVWGDGLNLSWVASTATGAIMRGLARNSGTMSIGNNAYGAMQNGAADNGTMSIGTSSYGAMQNGLAYLSGSMSIGSYAGGAMQNGYAWGGFATNNGIGALQLLYLSAGQQALTTDGGAASVLLGAGISSNKNAIVAGDGSVSHGDGSITASGGFWHGANPVITDVIAGTNIVISTNANAVTINSTASGGGGTGWTNTFGATTYENLGLNIQSGSNTITRSAAGINYTDVSTTMSNMVSVAMTNVTVSSTVYNGQNVMTIYDPTSGKTTAITPGCDSNCLNTTWLNPEIVALTTNDFNNPFNGSTNSVDISSIVPAGITRIGVYGVFTGNAVGNAWTLYSPAQTNSFGYVRWKTLVAGQDDEKKYDLYIGTNRTLSGFFTGTGTNIVLRIQDGID